MALPPDYHERVYAGVLGKIIGVYLGRPFEQWSHEKIEARWGEIRRYVHEDCGNPLVVPDDDITGTFTFLRALDDHRSGRDLTSREIGQTWLNYIAEGRHILWWGGMGMSTEHTAYLRLMDGIPAPESGSITRNGRAVAEEIGAQIFIDGWALVSPGDPEQAARFAREAARVSHDGEAVHAAVLLAVMESLAFIESDIETLIERGLSFIPADCEIARMIADVRAWHRQEPQWREAMRRLREAYGYQKYRTNCPVVSNHGVIIVALLYGGGDFSETLTIANTAGYDTDCNSGNVGCLLGIRGGLAAIESGTYDWRTPINDRVFLPTAAGHQGVTDAATVAVDVIALGRRLAGEPRYTPKDGARYHFDLAGSTHGFASTGRHGPEGRVCAQTTSTGERVLALVASDDGRADAETATFLMPDARASGSYGLAATPALYPGQQVVAQVTGMASGRARLFVRVRQGGNELHPLESPWQSLTAGSTDELRWIVPLAEGWPVVTVGVEWESAPAECMLLHRLDWSGQPELELEPPPGVLTGTPWMASFAQNLDVFSPRWLATFNLAKNHGVGIAHTGARDWRDYEVAAELCPILGDDFGLVARVQGLTRYYALVVSGNGKLRLLRVCHETTELASTDLRWAPGEKRRLSLTVSGNRLTGSIDGRHSLEAVDPDALLDGGGAGWRITTGRLESGPLEVHRCVA